MAAKIVLTEEHRKRIEEFRARHKTGVLTLVFTDMVGSTELKRLLGDAHGTAMIEQQQNVVRETLKPFEEAEEISTAGDSFFITFIRPSDAVRFALLVHAKLRRISEESAAPIQLRIGIHMGEVFIDKGGAGGKTRDILGIQVDAASRVMLLAVGGQTLMTRSVFDNARAVLRGEELESLGVLAWLNHGYFKAAGVEEPFEVCEVGEEKIAPLSPPPSKGKIQRFTVPELQPVIGWHPALELEVPTARGWVLREKIGEGGFGEVWRAQHKTLKEHRVFKFCFHADRARSLKREVALFRLLREKVGEHPNIVRIHDVYFDDPPYYIVMEHIQATDLLKWCKEKGGVENVPYETRIKIVTEVADALQAAHEAGVIHRDVKPSNILIAGGEEPDEVKIWLTDFGIGEVLPGQDYGHLITSGLTDIGLQSELSSRTGTRVYMAPEILAGRSSSIKSDIFSLGVVLFQLVIEDLAQPVTTDWDDKVMDPVIAEDIARCFAGDPDSRFASAAEFAQNLRRLPERRIQWEEEEKLRLENEESLRKVTLQREAETRQSIYRSAIAQADKYIGERRYSEAREQLYACPKEERHWEWGRLIHLCNLDRATLRGHLGPVVCMAISPDGKRVATGGEDRRAIVWNFDTGEEVSRIPERSERVDSLCFHPDNRRLAVGAGDGSLSLWDTETGETLFEFGGHKNIVDSLAFSPDGQKLASGSWDNTARIWKVHTGQPIGVHESKSQLRVGFDENCQCLALGSWGEEAHIWDAEGNKQKAVLKGRFHGFGIIAAAFSPDGTLVATGGRDGTARVWDTETGQQKQYIKGHIDTIRALAFDPSNQYLMTGAADRTARVWDLKNGREFVEYRGHGDIVNAVAIGPDVTLPATASSDGTAKLWDSDLATGHKTFEGHSAHVWTVVFSEDGSELLTSSGEGVWEEGESDNTARVWNVETREELLQLDGHSSNVWSAAFHPREDRIATASADKTVKIWNRLNGEILKVLKGHEGFVLGCAFSPDGELLATCGRDETIRFWEWREGKELHVLSRHNGPVSAIAFTPDGTRLLSASWDQTAKIWDVKSGQELRTLAGHTSALETVAVSPDGRYIATGGKDNTIRYWDLESEEELPRVFEAPCSVASVVSSPDGKRLFSGCGDKTAKVWDIQTGKILTRMTGHQMFVVSVAISPDGRLLATGSSDRTAILWPAFPWSEEDYPDYPDLSLEQRIEIYKRESWRTRHSLVPADPIALARG